MISSSLPRIYPDERGLKHRERSEKRSGIFFNIYHPLGNGGLESLYEPAFPGCRQKCIGPSLRKRARDEKARLAAVMG